jgi:hypothetical protein
VVPAEQVPSPLIPSLPFAPKEPPEELPLLDPPLLPLDELPLLDPPLLPLDEPPLLEPPLLPLDELPLLEPLLLPPDELPLPEPLLPPLPDELPLLVPPSPELPCRPELGSFPPDVPPHATRASKPAENVAPTSRSIIRMVSSTSSRSMEVESRRRACASLRETRRSQACRGLRSDRSDRACDRVDPAPGAAAPPPLRPQNRAKKSTAEMPSDTSPTPSETHPAVRSVEIRSSLHCGQPDEPQLAYAFE